jgi:hypothetical protein
MSSRKKTDEIAAYKEWIEHKDNYWYRFNTASWGQFMSWRASRKRNRLWGFLGVFFWGFILTTMIAKDISEKQFDVAKLPFLIVGMISFLNALILLFQKASGTDTKD